MFSRFRHLALFALACTWCPPAGADIIYDIVSQCTGGCTGTATTTISLFDTYQPGTFARLDDVVEVTYTSSSGTIQNLPLQPSSSVPSALGVLPANTTNSADLNIDYIRGGTQTRFFEDESWFSRFDSLGVFDSGNGYSITRRGAGISDIGLQTISFDLSGYTTNAAGEIVETSNPIQYDLSFIAQTLIVELDIRLWGGGTEGLSDLVDDWGTGIDNLWNNFGNNFYVEDQGNQYDIVFDVNFSTGLLPSVFADANVRVIDNNDGDPAQPNALTWYTNAGGFCTEEAVLFYSDVCSFAGEEWAYNQQTVAAHEIGHLLGLFDEYDGSPFREIPTGPLPDFDPTGLMQSLSAPVQHRYLEDILDWLIGESGRPDMVLGGAPLPFDYGPIPDDFEVFGGEGKFASNTVSVPEPGTLALLCIGLAGMGFSRRRKKV